MHKSRFKERSNLGEGLSRTEAKIFYQDGEQSEIQIPTEEEKIKSRGDASVLSSLKELEQHGHLEMILVICKTLISSECGSLYHYLQHREFSLSTFMLLLRNCLDAFLNNFYNDPLPVKSYVMSDSDPITWNTFDKIVLTIE